MKVRGRVNPCPKRKFLYNFINLFCYHILEKKKSLFDEPQGPTVPLSLHPSS
jgi:hypothetical protein